MSVSITAASVSALFCLVSARAQAAPAAGTNELRLDNSILAGVSVSTNGFTHIAPKQGSDTTLFGAGVGFGHFVTDNIELGGGLSYSNVNGDLQIPGINAFFRGFGMAAAGTGGFGEAVVQYQRVEPNQGSGTSVVSVGANVGLERFFTESWALRIQATYRHLFEFGSGVSSSNNSEDAIGFGWGIAAYF
jgi:hypothetical protein